jgi:hypothetical protein
MSNYKIKSIKTTDSISKLAKTAVVTVVANAEVNTPAAEFGLPGDTGGALTITDLRPNGSTLDLRISYDNIPYHSIFSGHIEFMDDLDNPDVWEAELDLTELPPGNQIRKPMSYIYNFFPPGPTADPDAVTAKSIILAQAAAAGINVGRLDFPDYNVNGSFEVNHESVIELTKSLIEPFNLYPYLQYHVRCNNDGLQVIGINYLLGSDLPTGASAYPLLNYKSLKGKFEQYIPDRPVGDCNILLLGANIPGAESKTWNAKHLAEETFTITDSVNTNTLVNQSPTGAIPNSFETNYSVVDTTIDVIILFTGYDDTNVPSNWSPEKKAARTRTLFGTPDSPPLTVIPNTEKNPDGTIPVQFAPVQYVDSYSIIAQNPQQIVQSDYANGELTKVTTTSYTYGLISITSGPSYAQTTQNRRVLLSDRREEVIYPNGQAFNFSASTTTYTYDNEGSQTSTITDNYAGYQNEWIYTETQTQVQHKINLQDSITATESSDQAFKQEYGVTVLSQGNVNNVAPSVSETSNGQGIVSRTVTSWVQSMDQFRLWNGEIITKANYWQIIGGVDPNNPYDLLDLNIQELDRMAKTAYRMTFSHMDYAGLYLIWAIIQQEEALEHGAYYWDILTAEMPIDSVPVVGTSVVINGKAGICEDVSHDIDGDHALSTVTIKRLINGS